MPKKSGLGRGLDALFSENSGEAANASRLRLSEIEPNKNQPRKHFDTDALNELSTSIREHGVLQPLIVRPLPSGAYQLVAGERRWRAARMAELTEVPVIIRDLSDSEAMEIAIIENLQREDLNPIEEALGYDGLIKALSLTQEEAAKRVGKSRPAVANSLRLLALPDEVKVLVSSGKISAGSARALLAVPSELFDEAVKKALSGATVREIEVVSKQAERKKNTSASRRSKYYDEAELSLTEALGRPVRVISKSRGGVVQIEFYGAEDLGELARRIGK